MSIVNSIEAVRDWLDDNVCQKVKLKLPDDNAMDASYTYKLVHPTAFSLFLPTKDRQPPKVEAPIPSVCVQLVQGEDNLVQKSRSIKIRLQFSAWDPGLHKLDMINPHENQVGTDFFQKNSDGWLDAWNFLDTAIRALENAEYISGFRLIKEAGITFGPVVDQDNASDFYPFWFAWTEFSLAETLTRNPSYSHLI